MSEQETKCYHKGFLKMYDNEGFPIFDEKTPCPDCGKTQGEIYLDVNDIDPTTKVSQQPHGKATYYCGKCQMMVEPMTWNNKKCCPYHQRYFDDGTPLWDDVSDDDW